MQQLQDRCADLESLCKARRAEAWERSQTYLLFQERYTSVSIKLFSRKISFNPLLNNPWFLCVCSIRLLKTLWKKEKCLHAVYVLKTLWKKEKLLLTSNFSFFHSVFYPFKELSAIFITFKIVVCKLLELERV